MGNITLGWTIYGRLPRSWWWFGISPIMVAEVRFRQGKLPN